ncbi:hypothetical protein MY10362_000780 [Beauveria mimosiformis]
MANQVTLMQFLQQDPQRICFHATMANKTKSDKTTTNAKYLSTPILKLSRWDEFNIDTILRDFGHLLNNPDLMIGVDALTTSPPPPVGAEDGLRELIATYSDRPIRRALARTFEYMAQQGSMVGRTRMTLGAGTSAVTVDSFIPDRALYDPDAPVAINRLPGEVKPSHKFHSEREKFAVGRKKVWARLAQLSYYMALQGIGKTHSGSKYGFVLTEKELVTFRKRGEPGYMEWSGSIPWGGAETTRSDGNRLTVLLGLWYLAMLASSDDDWHRTREANDPTDEKLRNPTLK